MIIEICGYNFQEKEYYIFGITVFALSLGSRLLEAGKKVTFIDNNPNMQGNRDVFGADCISIDAADKRIACVISVKTEKSTNEIKSSLASHGFDSIICLGIDRISEYERNLSDEIFLKYRWIVAMRKKLDLTNPRSFNEKIQWLKLYDRNPEYTRYADKYEAKNVVAEMIGEQYIIPLLGVWDTPRDIDFNSLPESFVLKCTHDSGSVAICKNKNDFDFDKVDREFSEALKINYYSRLREPQYKNIRPRVIAEKLLLENDETPSDYKVHCFAGVPKLIQVDFDRFTNHKRNLYTPDWNYVNAEILYKTDPSHVIERPEKLDEMMDLAKILSANIPYVRVDFYYVNNRVYFGEMTFHHGSGYEPFTPEEFNYTMGEWIELP